MKNPRQVRPPSAAIVVAAIHPGARDNLADQCPDLELVLGQALILTRPQPCQNRLLAMPSVGDCCPDKFNRQFEFAPERLRESAYDNWGIEPTYLNA